MTPEMIEAVAIDMARNALPGAWAQMSDASKLPWVMRAEEAFAALTAAGYEVRPVAPSGAVDLEGIERRAIACVNRTPTKPYPIEKVADFAADCLALIARVRELEGISRNTSRANDLTPKSGPKEITPEAAAERKRCADALEARAKEWDAILPHGPSYAGELRFNAKRIERGDA